MRRGKILNREWGVRARHALYSRDGRCYEKLERFPGAYFDDNGYVLFKTEADFLNCPALNIRKKVNVPFPGISKLSGYILVVANTIDGPLSQIEEEELNEYFNPKDVHDARERTYALIDLRSGQPRFRKDLMEAYEGRCAITGCDVKETLEAAHILPYKGDHTNKLANGLLLRADIHTLFDLGLIAIDTSTMKVILSSMLANTEYDVLNGSRLKVSLKVWWRIKVALDEHRTTYFCDAKYKR